MTAPPPAPEPSMAAAQQPARLRSIALARSGDKGNRATLSVIALDPRDYPRMEQALTVARVRAQYMGQAIGRIDRFALPHLAAVHFVLHDALSGGVTRSLALDGHGKSLSSLILDLPLDAGPDTQTSVKT